MRSLWKVFANFCLEAATLLLSIGALLAAFYWFWIASEKAEPIVTIVGIITAIWGLIINPWVESHKARTVMFEALRTELITNRMILTGTGESFNHDFSKGNYLYCRLIYASIDRAISKGLFSGTRHTGFRLLLQRVRFSFETYNIAADHFQIVMMFGDPNTNKRRHGDFIKGQIFLEAAENIKDLENAFDLAQFGAEYFNEVRPMTFYKEIAELAEIHQPSGVDTNKVEPLNATKVNSTDAAEIVLFIDAIFDEFRRNTGWLEHELEFTEPGISVHSDPRPSQVLVSTKDGFIGAVAIFRCKGKFVEETCLMRPAEKGMFIVRFGSMHLTTPPHMYHQILFQIKAMLLFRFSGDDNMGAVQKLMRLMQS